MMGHMRLLLVRHGQTSSNIGHHLDTAAPGADLTEFGRTQAAAVPEALADEDIRAVYASTLVRTQQTAEPLACELGLEVRVRDGLREIAAGDLEMRNDRDGIERYVRQVFGWEGDLDERMPGAETGREVLDRFDAVVAEAEQEVGDGGTVVCFAHGAVIRMWSALRGDNIDLAFASDRPLENTAMVALEGGSDQGWTVASWTDTALGGSTLTDTRHTGPGGEPDDDPYEPAPNRPGIVTR